MLLGVGVVASASSYAIRPDRADVIGPAFSSVLVESEAPIAILDFEVHRDEPDTSTVFISAKVFTGGSGAPPDGSIFFTFPRDAEPAECVEPRPCLHLKDSYFWTAALKYDDLGSATVTIPVRGERYAFDDNGVSAAAALPEVEYQGNPDSQLNVKYAMDDPSAYDWTGIPPSVLRPGFIVWTEQVDDGRVDPQVVTGLDRTAANRDRSSEFLAGALIGVAGGAVVGALQEALNVRRRSEKGPGQPSA
jgi:hypothetical protein